jgi:hypothetical protein
MAVSCGLRGNRMMYRKDRGHNILAQQMIYFKENSQMASQMPNPNSIRHTWMFKGFEPSNPKTMRNAHCTSV